MHTEVDADLIFLRLLQQVVVQLDPVYSLSGESEELSAVMILPDFVSMISFFLPSVVLEIQLPCITYLMIKNR